MKSSAIVPLDQAKEFVVNELFFSTTDDRGRITSCNQVFQRVSGYARRELMGTAHNIIRHPDMPRTVFKLVWDTIRRGQAIVGYVKNLSQDGRYYWVLAYITPIAGGYLSIRLKPTAGMVEKLIPVYAELVRIEQAHADEKDNGKAGMAAAEARLGEILRSLGFKDYDAFMRAALQLEIKSRDTELDRRGLVMFPPQAWCGNPKTDSQAAAATLGAIYSAGLKVYARVDSLFHHLDEFSAINRTLQEKSQAVTGLTANFRLISFNSAIEASRIGHVGAGLGIISAHMGETAAQVGGVVGTLKREIAAASEQLREADFALAAIRLQIEMLLVFCDSLLRETGEAQDGNPAQTQEGMEMIAMLKNAFQGTNAKMAEMLRAFAANLANLGGSTEDLRRSMVTMQVATVGGMVEANRLHSESFQQIFQEVREEMEGANRQLNDLVDALTSLDLLAKDAPQVAVAVSEGCEHVEREIAALARA